MHPSIYAKRRAEVHARLTDGLTALAERAGLEVPPAQHYRDTAVTDLYRLEQMAEVLDAINSPYVRPGSDESPSPPPQDAQGSDVLSGTVPEVKDALSEVDDVEELRRLHDEEAKGRDRKGVQAAIEERIEEIEE
jgi:hypothetical protein